MKTFPEITHYGQDARKARFINPGPVSQELRRNHMAKCAEKGHDIRRAPSGLWCYCCCRSMTAKVGV